MTQVRSAIEMFLNAKKLAHNGPDLLERWTPNMETQVNVAAGEGEAVPDKRSTFTDGINEWWSIRVPKKANSQPEFRDYPLSWPLELHAEAIGSTGWDWVERRSKWVGFDFDAITGHAAGVGIGDQELRQVRAAAQALPYVEVRRSTGGMGLHLYVLLDGISTANHTEHAAMARAILGKMSADTGFDFATQVDACGGNLWIWHRKSTAENQGLALLKAAERPLAQADLPANWRDHIEVVANRRSKVRVSGIGDEDLDVFEALTSSRAAVPLDEGHKAIIDALGRSGFTTVWIPDHRLLQTHTVALDRLRGDASLKIKGVFQTTSKGTDPGTPNCFAFPLPKGAWKVYRFSPGTAEAATWSQNGSDWTTCYFNHRPSLSAAAQAAGGAELAGNGGFMFETAAEAVKAIEAMGGKISLPRKFRDRETILKPNKDGRLVIGVKLVNNEKKPGVGWVVAKKIWWECVLNVQAEQNGDDSGSVDYDQVVRALVTPAKERAGWIARSEDGRWVRQPKDDAKSILLGLGLAKTLADQVLGVAARRCWWLVNLPFRPEYLGDRKWNLHAPQYVFQAASTDDPQHPTWDAILAHIGAALDDAVKSNPWCRAHGVKSGAQWLLLWYACVLRDPFCKLPYLFLWGPSDSGKSTFHEAFELLVTSGCVDAKRALTNKDGFNGELDGAVLGFIDEYDLSTNKQAALRIKEWVTALTISIRRMRTNLYHVANTLHFVHLANDPSYVSVLPQDARIVICHVPAPPAKIPKEELHARLKQEAPQFMRTILDLTLPPPDGRMRIAVLETDDKADLVEDNEPIAKFLADECELKQDAKTLKADLYERYVRWCRPNNHDPLAKAAFGKRLITATGGMVNRRAKMNDPDGKRRDCYQGIALRGEVGASEPI